MENLFNDLIDTSIRYLLPIVAAFVIGYIGLLIKNTLDEMKAKQPVWFKLVVDYAPILVRYLEQERKRNNISKENIEAMANVMVSSYLREKGVAVDVLNDERWKLVKSIIEAEVNKLPKFQFNTDQ